MEDAKLTLVKMWQEKNIEHQKTRSAIGCAIKSIEKQEPIKPINNHCICGADVRNWTGDDPFNYCPECGQKIDWSEEE